MFDFDFILNVAKGTPTWVYAIFAYLFYVGIKATKARTVSVYKILIVPTVMTSWSIVKILGAPSSFLFFLLFFPVGILIGDFLLPMKVENVDRSSRVVTLPGSWTTLILLMIIFSIKYFFGFMHATNPGFIENYHFLEKSIFSLWSGIFWGRRIKPLAMVFASM